MSGEASMGMGRGQVCQGEPFPRGCPFLRVARGLLRNEGEIFRIREEVVRLQEADLETAAQKKIAGDSPN